MTLTNEQLLTLFPSAKNTPLGLDAVVAALNNTFPKLSNPRAAAMFLAQTGEESQEYTHFVENLNYSWDALLHIFPSHFKGQDDAIAYNRKPEKIANRIYANRMGNGDEASGDGWKYRGRGAIQCTGKANYVACAKFLNIDVVTNPDLLATLPGAFDSAVWFWNMRNISHYAALEDVKTCTRLINGGTLGLNFRQSSYTLAKQLLGVT